MGKERSSISAGIVLAIFIGGLLGASIMSNLIEPKGAFLTLNGDKSDWLGFVGSLIGAGATIAAGVLAWRAVQRQIVDPQIRAIEIIEGFASTARAAGVEIRAAITDMIQRNTDYTNNETSVDMNHRDVEIKQIMTIFNKWIIFEKDLPSAYGAAPPTVVHASRTLEEQIALCKEEVCNPKKWTDIKALRNSVDRVYICADDVLKATNRHKEGV